ncbi:MAG: EscU/YscU/HrcU family type III secretion system export apparatus switch protein [Clostridiales bacterium]|nr:EscU/YscU/HrcU family type III secretion system export apparatus switch protein [Clostridiales bacterium]
MTKDLKDLKAAALKYDPAFDDVPLLTAFGKGYVAEKIIALAEESRIPVVYDAALTEMLGKMNLGDDIPPELYAVVAQILVFVSQSDQAYAQRLGTLLK